MRFRLPLLAALGLSIGLVASAATRWCRPKRADLQLQANGRGRGRQLQEFEAQLDFDPKKPEAGKIAFTVDLGSVSLGDPTYDAELGKPLWFDTKRNGKATFVSSAIKPTGAGKYDVAGKLSIKGATRDVVVPITLAGGVPPAACPSSGWTSRSGTANGPTPRSWPMTWS